MIRGVVFDFGNVICCFEYDRFLERLRPYSGLPVGALRERVFGSGIHRRFERGDIDTAAFDRLVAAAIGADVSAETIEEAFLDIFTPVEGTQALIRALAGRYRLGLLSNTNELHFRRCIRPVPVFPLFDAVTLSYEVRALKPEAAIYRDALRKLSLPAEECVYIDDIPEYVEGAKSVGMRGIRFSSPERLREELAEMGVRAG